MGWDGVGWDGMGWDGMSRNRSRSGSGSESGNNTMSVCKMQSMIRLRMARWSLGSMLRRMLVWGCWRILKVM